jgi:hypothetical protein
MRNTDEIDKIEEWQEHQYNPLYWVDRFSPLFPPKRTWGSWITSLIGLFLNLPAFVAFCWSYFADRNRASLPWMLVFGALSVILALLVIRLKPDFDQGKSQPEAEEKNRMRNQQKKKKLPKRRKDYS